MADSIRDIADRMRPRLFEVNRVGDFGSARAEDVRALYGDVASLIEYVAQLETTIVNMQERFAWLEALVPRAQAEHHVAGK